MMMKVIAGCALACCCGWALTACASANGSSDTPSKPRVTTQASLAFHGSPAPGSAPFPAVTGAFGQQPHISAGVQPAPTTLTTVFLSAGNGPRVVAGTAPVVRYVKSDWATGKVAHDSWAAGIARDTLPTAGPNIALSSILNGIKLGTRLEVMNPNSAGGVDVYVIDVLAQGPSASKSG